MPEKAGPSAEEAVEGAGVGDGVGFGTKTGFVVGAGKQAVEDCVFAKVLQPHHFDGRENPAVLVFVPAEIIRPF